MRFIGCPGRCMLTAAASLAAASVAAAQPAPPVRVIAEWEPAVGSLISWPLGIPQELVVELAADDMLYVLVTGPNAENQARAAITSWGVDPAQLEFIHSSVQTHWPRDWGPHQVFDGDGVWGVIDPIFEGYPWVFNACVPITSPGGHNGDDAVPIDFAAHFGAPLHSFPAYLTGGNFLVDGHSSGFSTCAMVGENEQLWTEAQFLQLAEDWLGVSSYHVLDSTEDYGIQHIDCWFKPLDEETLLVKLPPTWHEEYDRIETNLQALASAVTCYGRPYRIIRIDCPPYDGSNIAAYCNSLILNKKVFVPLFNIPGDAQAIQTFQDAMPGYEVIGVPWGSWYYYDALHCRVRAVFDRHMLRITHRRMDDEVPYAPEHIVEAMIDDRSEAGLIADELRVYHREQGAPQWESVLLALTGAPDVYAGAIPGSSEGATIEYYLAAADNSGRAETLPRTAPDGFYSFTIINAGLTISVTDPPLLIPPGESASFNVVIDPGDESIVPGSETLHYRYDGGDYISSPLSPLGGYEYLATLPAATCTDAPQFYISAEGSDSGVVTAPPDAPATVFAAQVGELVEVELFARDFESGLPPGWTVDGLWHVTDACEISPTCDGLRWAYYGQDATCNYDTGQPNSGAMTSALIALPAIPPGGAITLSYCSAFETENEPGYDVAALLVNGGIVDAPAQAAAWETRSVDLTTFAGQSIDLAWTFDTIDDYYNDYHGWQIDAVTITYSELDCVIACPADVNGDQIVDVLDLLAVLAAWGAAGGPEDINGDGVVDLLDLLELLAAWGPCE